MEITSPVYVSGYHGQLGKAVMNECWRIKRSVFTLKAEIGGGTIYPHLNEITSGTIIHCGADALRDSIDMLLYKKNITATQQIVDHVQRNSRLRIIFTSASSLGAKLRWEAAPTSMYCYSKLVAEMTIHDHIPPNRYTIIRLPGLYEPGVRGKGILDRLYYEDAVISPSSASSQFSNIALVRDVAMLLVNLSARRDQIGYAGRIQAITSLPMSVLSTIIKTRSMAHPSHLRSNVQNTVLDKEFCELGFPRRDMLELLRVLYFK